MHPFPLLVLFTFLEFSAAGESPVTRQRVKRSVSVALNLKTVNGLSHVHGRNVLGKKSMYYGQLGVGTPSQNFSVVFDTGSGNLLIPGSTCQSSACTMHKRFHAKKSSSSSEVNCGDGDIGHSQVEIDFGTGSIHGTCMRDEICLGDTCTQGSFIATTQETANPFANYKFDGVLGLSLKPLARGPEFSFFDVLAKTDSVEPVFSVFLSESDAETSEITFGEIKKSHFEGDLFWVDVLGDIGYWEVQIEDIALDNELQGICENCRVAVDTGTSELAGPSHVMRKIKSSLRSSLSGSCDKTKLPKLGFQIGGRILNLEPQDYVKQGLFSCSFSMMDLDVPPPNGPIFVFGIPFLQKFYTAYDLNERKVGFAVAKHLSGPKPGLMVQLDKGSPITTGAVAKKNLRKSHAARAKAISVRLY